MDDVIVRFLHLLGAAIWIGGLFSLGVVAVSAKSIVPEAERPEFFRAMGRRFLWAQGIALLLLVGAGQELARKRHMLSWDALTGSTYGKELLAKMTLLAFVVLLSIYHSFVQGPAMRRLREASLAAPDDEALAARVRSAGLRSGIVQLVILLASLTILFLAADLVS